MYAVSPRWAQHPQLKRSSAPGRAGVIYSKFGKLYMGTPSALPVYLDALPGDSYRGEKLPSQASHRFYQPLKPWNEPERRLWMSRQYTKLRQSRSTKRRVIMKELSQKALVQSITKDFRETLMITKPMNWNAVDQSFKI